MLDFIPLPQNSMFPDWRRVAFGTVRTVCWGHGAVLGGCTFPVFPGELSVCSAWTRVRGVIPTDAVPRMLQDLSSV